MPNVPHGNFLQWLRGFQATANLGGVSRAARHLGLDQSAVSHQIKNLERLLNIDLFQRGHKRLTLTEAGRQLLQKSVPIFEHVRGILQEVGCVQGILHGEIHVASTMAIGKHFLTKILLDFQREYPQVRIEVSGGGFAHIMNSVNGGEADFGIIPLAEPDAPPGFAGFAGPFKLVSKPLFASKLVVLSPRGNPFRLPHRPSLADIARVPFISFPPYGTVESFLRPMLAEKKIEFNRVAIANTYTLLQHYVMHGMGVTILDMFTIEDIAGNFDIFDVGENLPHRKYTLIRRADKYVSPQAFEFQSKVLRSAFPYGCSAY
jgi:DNA-binding transcriptional LysR family regulator